MYLNQSLAVFVRYQCASKRQLNAVSNSKIGAKLTHGAFNIPCFQMAAFGLHSGRSPSVIFSAIYLPFRPTAVIREL
jgi:hypothetical protein